MRILSTQYSIHKLLSLSIAVSLMIFAFLFIGGYLKVRAAVDPDNSEFACSRDALRKNDSHNLFREVNCTDGSTANQYSKYKDNSCTASDNGVCQEATCFWNNDFSNPNCLASVVPPVGTVSLGNPTTTPSPDTAKQIAQEKANSYAHAFKLYLARLKNLTSSQAKTLESIISGLLNKVDPKCKNTTAKIPECANSTNATILKQVKADYRLAKLFDILTQKTPGECAKVDLGITPHFKAVPLNGSNPTPSRLYLCLGSDKKSFKWRVLLDSGEWSRINGSGAGTAADPKFFTYTNKKTGAKLTNNTDETKNWPVMTKATDLPKKVLERMCSIQKNIGDIKDSPIKCN